MNRIATLFVKELLELRRLRLAWATVLLLAAVDLALPFGIIAIPRLTGASLSRDAAVRGLVGALSPHVPRVATLPPAAAAQAVILREFLPLLMLIPIGGATTIAGYSVVGEKQARSLEPLLATPITTGELLLAKLLGAAAPPFAVMIVTFLLYIAGIVWFAAPGVLAVVMTPSSLVTVFLFGAITTAVAVTVTATISSRVNDPRSAQQIGVLIILPVSTLLVAQFSGSLFLGGGLLAAVIAAGAALEVVLFLVAIRLFERETILTRWK